MIPWVSLRQRRSKKSNAPTGKRAMGCCCFVGRHQLTRFNCFRSSLQADEFKVPSRCVPARNHSLRVAEVAQFFPWRSTTDKNKEPDAQAKFVEIAEAYTVLSDEKSRTRYDQMGQDSERCVLDVCI